MSGRSKFFLTLLGLIFLFICFEITLYYYRGNDLRDRDLLLNQYYSLRNTNPEAAKKALMLLYQQNPRDLQALEELGFLSLREGNTQNAIKYFQLSVNEQPKNAKLSFELAKLYILMNQKEKALSLLKIAITSNDLNLKKSADELLNQLSPKPEVLKEADKIYTPIPSLLLLANTMSSSTPYSPIPSAVEGSGASSTNKVQSTAAKYTPVKPMTDRDKLLNQFYDNKDKNRAIAWSALKTLLHRYPNDVTALKEAGYLALSEKKSETAFDYLNRAYLLTSDPMLAMQLAYLLDGQKKHKEAYHYFKLATKNPKLDERYKAEIALTNLRGVQTKILPYPYYIDLFYNPVYFSRFTLTVHPIIARFGRVINEPFQWLLYLSYRRTFDNRSGLVGALPQIFQDSTSIYSIGSQISPFSKIPLVAFLEVGKARNLVAGISPHWRGDLRGGLAFYTEWGREASFMFHPCFPMKYVADLYGDLIYYSRYQNWIGTVRWRPGVEVIRYLATSLDLYFRGFLIEDTQREFFNNLVEYGLGATFIPSDRYNIAFRYEFTEGYYLPSAGSSANPYGAKYHNTVIECDLFFRL